MTQPEIEPRYPGPLAKTQTIMPMSGRLIGLVGRVFANGPGDRGSNPRSRHTKDFKNST